MTAAAMLGLWMLQAPAARARVEGPTSWKYLPVAASEPPTGKTMRNTGAVLTAIGGTFLVAGAGMFLAQARCQAQARGECWWFVPGLWMAPLGLVTTSVGVPLLVAGLRRHRRWRAWRDQHGLTLQPRVGGTHGGWSVGLALRF